MLDIVIIVIIFILTAADIAYYRIPNSLVAATGIAAVLTSFAPSGFGPLLALAGGAIAGGLIAFTAWTYRWSTGVAGLGGGDVKLAVALGIWVGPFGAAPLLTTAALLALATVATSSFGGVSITRSSKIPFGPFLGLAACLVKFVQVTVL